MNEQKTTSGTEESRKERRARLLERGMLSMLDRIKDDRESSIIQLNNLVVLRHWMIGSMLNRLQRWTGVNPVSVLQNESLVGRFGRHGVRLDEANIVAMMRFAAKPVKVWHIGKHTWEQICVMLDLDDQALFEYIMFIGMGFQVPLDDFQHYIADCKAWRMSSSDDSKRLYNMWRNQPVDLRIPLRSRAVQYFLHGAASECGFKLTKLDESPAHGSPDKLYVRVHRGTHEIGGSCIELMAGGKRIILDLGLSLAEGGAVLPVPATLREALAGPALLGVVISHAHADHCGLVDLVPDDIPVYIGEAAGRMLREARFFGAPGWSACVTHPIAHRKTFSLGPFTITPLLVDHSAFDAYALLVEANGQRLLYSGDLRAHGRKPGTFAALLDGSLGTIDTLLLEGTAIRPEGVAPEDNASEQDVENDCAATFGSTRGLALVYVSAQNIDRLVTLYRAGHRSGRVLVMDLYTATMAAATGCSTIPQADWDGVRVWLPQSQRRCVVESGEFWRTDRIRQRRIFVQEIGRNPERFVVVCRGTTLSELARDNCLSGATAVWSLWRGYLDKPETAATRALLHRCGVPLVVHHSSGHARVEDLCRLVVALAPRQVVPVHTAHPDLFAEHFANTNVKIDGDWWEA